MSKFDNISLLSDLAPCDARGQLKEPQIDAAQIAISQSAPCIAPGPQIRASRVLLCQSMIAYLFLPIWLRAMHGSS